jgi:hypothetical protein
MQKPAMSLHFLSATGDAEATPKQSNFTGLLLQLIPSNLPATSEL